MKFNPNMYTIFETITGSRLYGTNVEGSDYDKRGVCIPPYEVLLNPFQKFEQLEETVIEDRVIYSLAKFVDLATQNNPNILELLFAPKGFWIKGSWQWEMIVEKRDLFLSRRQELRRIHSSSDAQTEKWPARRLQASRAGREVRLRHQERHAHDEAGLWRYGTSEHWRDHAAVS
jgi:hypothetical protein